LNAVRATNRAAEHRSAPNDAVSTFEEESHYTTAENDATILGTVGHSLIEGLARARARDAIASFSPSIRAIAARLRAAGMRSGLIESGARTLANAIERIKPSTHFAFIHDPDHLEAADELALILREGRTNQSLRVDRTFVTRDGVRWIVDYKFVFNDDSVAHEDQLMRDFTERHSKQLDSYRRVFSSIAPQTPVRAALYLPIQDIWIASELSATH
jgi:ATP-dependent helicase/nuclease subunit A